MMFRSNPRTCVLNFVAVSTTNTLEQLVTQLAFQNEGVARSSIKKTVEMLIERNDLDIDENGFVVRVEK